MRQTQTRYLTFILASIGLALTVFLIVYRNGVALTPDGWGLWQGAYSLLHDGQYRYFSGAPIIGWPPAYSAYLAALMAIFGGSGLTLMIANGLLLTFQAVGWGALYAYVFASRLKQAHFIQLALLTAFLSTFLALSQGNLLSHNLLLSIFPFLYISASKAFFEPDNGLRLQWFVIYAVFSAVFVNAHHTGVPIIAALTLVGLSRRGPTVRQKLLHAIAISLPPAIAWGVVSSAFHLWSRREFGGSHGPFEYLLQALTGLGSLWGPEAIALPIGIVGVACLVFASRVLEFNRRETQFLTTACVFFALQLLLFSSTFVGDPLQGRFLWLFILSVSPLLFIGRLNHLAGIVFIFGLGATAMTASRAVKWTVNRMAEPSNIIEKAAYISREPEPGQRLVRGGVILIGPPRYSWESVEEPQQARGEGRNQGAE